MSPYFTAFQQFKPRAGSSMIFGSPDRFPRILPGFLAHQVVGFLVIMELILHQSPFPHPDKQARDQNHMLAGPRNGLLSRPVVNGILHQGLKIIRGILYFSRQPALRTSNAVDQDHFSGIRKGCPPFYTAQTGCPPGTYSCSCSCRSRHKRSYKITFTLIITRRK